MKIQFLTILHEVVDKRHVDTGATDKMTFEPHVQCVTHQESSEHKRRNLIQLTTIGGTAHRAKVREKSANPALSAETPRQHGSHNRIP